MAAAGGKARPAAAAPAPRRQRGGFILGLVIGLLAGLGVALVVALYITKAPVPFVNKVPQRTPEQDAAEAERNRHWDPNAPLAGKNPARPQPVASEPAAVPAPGVATPAPAPQPVPGTAPAAAPAPVAALPAPASAAKPAATASATRPGRDPAAILAGQDQAAATAPGRAGTAAPAPAGPASGAAVQFYVQVGAYSTPEDADAQRAKVAMTGLSAKVLSREQNGRTVYRVRLGPYDNRTVAEDVQDKLAGAGMEANLVRVER